MKFPRQPAAPVAHSQNAAVSPLAEPSSKTQAQNDPTAAISEPSAEHRVSFSLESNDISVVDYKLSNYKLNQKLGDEFFGKDLYDIQERNSELSSNKSKPYDRVSNLGENEDGKPIDFESDSSSMFTF